MEYPSRIPSQLRPFEIKGLTVSEYPVTQDNGEYYIDVPITSRGSMFVTFYDENGNRLNDVNYKLSEDKITIYIGEPTYNRLDLVIFSNGQYFDQIDIWAQNPENHMELFSLDLYDIPKKTDDDYDAKMAVLNEYRLAVGRKSAPTYNMTVGEILRYFEQEGIFPLFLRVDGYLRNVAGFDNSAARSNLEILSKEEIWGRWNSDNEYTNPTGLMYNQNLFNGGGDGTDGRLPNSDVELLRDNNASLHLYGLNQNMPKDSSRRIEMNNVVAVKGEWNKYVWPYLDYPEYKIREVYPTIISTTPVFKDGYFRTGGYAVNFLSRDWYDQAFGARNMFKFNKSNAILFQKKYWNNTTNTGDHHTMDNRSNWYMSVVVNLHFAVGKNSNLAVLNFDTTGQVKQYLDSLLLSTTQKYDIGDSYTVLTGQRFRTHYKGKCYDGPENAYKKNEDSNSLTYYGYDSYNNHVSGTREPQSLFDFESYTNFYPFGSYSGDLYPGTDSDSKKYVSSVYVGNSNSGWNMQNPDAYTIVPDTNPNIWPIWHNRSVAYLAFNRITGEYCIMLFMQPEINKEDNINQWGNNEWWVEGDSILM